MSKSTIIIFLTIFLCIPFLTQAQTTAQKGISAEEKRALEKRFAGLKTFYIDDDGAVVFYQETEDAETSPQNTQKKETPLSTPKVKVKVTVDEEGDYVVTSEEPIIHEEVKNQDTPKKKEEQVQPEEIPASKVIIEEEYKYIDNFSDFGNQDNTKNAAVPTGEAVGIEIVEAIDEEDSDSSTETEEEKPDENIEKKEVFKKRVSSYKSLEEAALAVDELLEELKKQQSQYNNPKSKNSLSQKASGKVDGSLKKAPYQFETEPKEEKNKDVSADLETEETNNSPTYYINGVESTKEDVEKLKSSDILKKSVKRSDTNPNGEWWIETVK